ncbi:MAG: DUF4212 domain-containing protein [Ignavibacteriales bacterium]|nr:DUF4212 domain-containing protein [Ignavibacteriales bacterium]
MTQNNEQLEVNFFKSVDKHFKANRKLILTLAIIWAVAVFGFQFLLMALEEPTPEKSYSVFQSVWEDMQNENATFESKKDFAITTLLVLGKNVVLNPEHKPILKESFSWAIYSMQPDSIKYLFNSEPSVESINQTISSLELDEDGLDKILRDLIPSSLIAVNSENLSDNCKEQIPSIMSLYLIHNQSELTNFTFLGFPFHYWYTAQFLLIMFVILCLIYAVLIEKINKKHDFVEET